MDRSETEPAKDSPITRRKMLKKILIWGPVGGVAFATAMYGIETYFGSRKYMGERALKKARAWMEDNFDMVSSKVLDVAREHCIQDIDFIERDEMVWGINHNPHFHQNYDDIHLFRDGTAFPTYIVADRHERPRFKAYLSSYVGSRVLRVRLKDIELDGEYILREADIEVYKAPPTRLGRLIEKYAEPSR